MTQVLDDPEFWNAQSEYQRLAHDFTSFYARQAWEAATVPPAASVLDIACGTGALALVAAQAGARVLATDFSPAMVDAVAAHRLPNIESRVMDGQALDLPASSFDAAFSIFGIMLFPDWRRGLAEMARVLKIGGTGTIATWKEPGGAAANLLLAQIVGECFPEQPQPMPVEGMNEFRQPARLRAAMEHAGFRHVSIVEVSHSFRIDEQSLVDSDQLFRFSPIWPTLSVKQRETVQNEIGESVSNAGGTLPVDSPALIATAVRANLDDT